MSYFIDISIFKRNKNYMCLYIGQFVSFVGTMITGVTLPYQIYTLTHSTLMVGLLGAVQLLPLLVTALVGGVFADRYPRRTLLLVAEAMLAIGSLLLVFNAHLASPSIWLLFIIAFFMSGINGLHRPALDSIVQQIVQKSDFPAVGSLNMFKASVCMIAGPAIGGVIIAHFGIVITYLIDFATFIISIGALLSMTHIPKPIQVDQGDISTLASIKQGFKYALSRQELVGTYMVDFLAMIFGMPTALFPAIAQSFGGAKALGLLYAAPAVGALILSFASGWTVRVKQHGKAIALAAGLWGITIILFGLSSNLWLALLFLAFSGAADAVSGIFRTIMWNETIPMHLRGRMSGIEMISYLSGPRLGDTEAGLVAAAFGVTFSVISGGILCVVGVAACCYFLPKFWHYHADRVEEKIALTEG